MPARRYVLGSAEYRAENRTGQARNSGNSKPQAWLQKLDCCDGCAQAKPATRISVTGTAEDKTSPPELLTNIYESQVSQGELWCADYESN